jgi:hypothetical protein
MSPAPWHRSKSRAVALLVSYLGLQASGLAHSVVVRHVLCVQHGEEVEVGDPLPAPPDPHRHATFTGHATCPIDGPHTHSDHHCVVAQQGRLDTPMLAAGLLIQPAVSVAGRAPPRLRTLASSPWRPLEVAPKTSPPV